ncbi:hypothetical protein FRC08_015502 [Ceratobasidium sp. 394]|nr:hypothetical protein FRC08_015502 [Ceratobasidium sp. 394]
MEYSHSKSIVHRDLKPENILLTDTTPRHAKVADFGLAKAAGDDTFLKTFCGTPVYLAPEVVDLCRQSREYTRLVDSWSIGAIVWFTLTNSLLFPEDGGRAITRFERQKIDWSHLTRRGLSSQCVDWIMRMLEPDPTRRMSIREALEHPWLAVESGPEAEEAPSASSSAWTLVNGASTATVVPSPLAGSSHSTASSWIHLSREFNVPRAPAPSLASGQARLQSTASLSSMPERGKLDRRLGRRFAPIPATSLRKCYSVV